LFTSENAEVLLEIFDMQGKNIKQEKLAAQQGANTIHVNISNLNSGLYFIKASASAKNIVCKFVKL
jgi:hypothetical protein